MVETKNTYRPCSDLDIRAASMRATHERLKVMDEAGQPTVNMFGAVLREEKAKFKAFGLYMAEKGSCDAMAWDDFKKAVNEHTKAKDRSKKAK